MVQYLEMGTRYIEHSTGDSGVELDNDIISRQCLNGSVVSHGYKVNCTFNWCPTSRAQR